MDITIKNYFFKWVEQYLFFPNPLQQLISIAFLPLTLIYCMIVAFKRIGAKQINFGIPVVSIGNLVVGGTGKTPVTITLAKKEEHPAIILRGYGRSSKGMHVISQKGKILADIETSGDEAYLYAKALPNTTVIVDEQRVHGILKAKELGCNIVFLDDGYRFHNILKYDILLRPKDEPTNVFCLPSGGYKETKMMYSFVPCVLKDGEDYTREVSFIKDGNILQELPENILLLTAISKPDRLLEYLPKDIECKTFIDHYQFTKSDIDTILTTYNDYTIITTAKDYYKLEKFNIPNLVLMNLDIKIKKEIIYS